MDFSWITVTGLDIGLLTVGVVGLWQMRKRYKRLQAEFNTYRQAAELRYDNLQAAFNAEQQAADSRYEELQAAFNAYQGTANLQYKELRKENDVLRADLQAAELRHREFQSRSDLRYNLLEQVNRNLVAELDGVKKENQKLQEVTYGMSGRYEEIKELLMNLLAKL